MLNNKVNLSGKILSQFQLSHSYKNEVFFSSEVQITKHENFIKSKFDIIKIICNKKLLENFEYKVGDILNIKGEFHSYNSSQGLENHLILFCFAKSIQHADEEKNEINIKGFVCKTPTLRILHNNLKICDILIAVNRNFNKSDYIPCVGYNSLAEKLITQQIGSQLNFSGSIQSRNYSKKISDNNLKNKIAYEVIIKKIL